MRPDPNIRDYFKSYDKLQLHIQVQLHDKLQVQLQVVTRRNGPRNSVSPLNQQQRFF